MNFLFALLILVLINEPINELPINYQNRWLEKELIKCWNVNLSSMEEIPNLSIQLVHPGKIFKVTNQDSLIGYVYVGRVNSCRQGGCSNIFETDKDASNFEFFDMYIIYDMNKTVQSIKIYDYQATHGQEICSKNWLKQFLNYENEPYFEVGKNIDSISGATISVYALTNEVNYINQLLKDL